MDTWKPNVQNIMQQFQDFDNKGYDIKNYLFNIVQNSKMHFNQCREVFSIWTQVHRDTKCIKLDELFNWKLWYIGVTKNFEELEQVPLDRSYKFLMSLDRNSIEKEIVSLGVEVHMFWEIPKVRAALNKLCKK